MSSKARKTKKFVRRINSLLAASSITWAPHMVYVYAEELARSRNVRIIEQRVKNRTGVSSWVINTTIKRVLA